MSKKIIGVTVGSPLPKPNLKQTDPRKGDYVKGKDIIPTKVSDLENDSGYLTDHQDISGKLDVNKLPEAINNALAQAKSSGEFDGKDGYTPQKGIDYFDGKDGEPGKDYVLTDDDKTEIAELAAGMVDIPDTGGNVDELEQLDILVETDMLPAVYNEDGKILTDENGNIILRY